MCTLLVNYRSNPAYSLLVAANRDEFYGRPSMPAHFWPEGEHQLLAGKDLQAGGTWMGVSRNGRWAAITNYREPAHQNPQAPTRGALVSSFLQGTQAALAYLQQLPYPPEAYNGFNLLVYDGTTLAYLSNRAGPPILLQPGIYGVSNAVLDTPWPKVVKGKAAWQAFTSQTPLPPLAAFLPTLQDTAQAPDETLPHTGVSQDLERMLSALCIQSPQYGTCVHTLVSMATNGEVQLLEVPVNPLQTKAERVALSFYLATAQITA